MGARESYRAMPALDPVNDGRHQLADLPLERESVPYVVSLPEHGLGAFIYTWVSKDSIAGSALVAFGPGLASPVAEKVDGIEVPRSLNFDDWKVGSVHFKQDLKLQNAEIVSKGERIAFEGRFEALHPAYAYSSHPEGCPDWAATDRLEQAGKLIGSITVDGKQYAFDTTAARDHSWGTRNWGTPQHWKWLHAQSDDTCVHFWQIQARGETTLRGYISRDGLMAQVSQVEIEFTVDDQYVQKTINATVHDTAGRTANVVGDYFGFFPFYPEPSCTLNEAAMSCTIDDQPGRGWSEFMWPTAYIDQLKAGQK